MLVNFVKRIGAEVAPDVAAFYVFHSDAFYIRSLHPVDLLLKNAEGLHTQWKNGKYMLGTRAREVERREHTSNSIDRAFENLAMMGVKFAET